MDYSFKKFLHQKISKYDEASFKDMFNDLFLIVIHWINRKNELVIINERRIFQQNFYAFLCNQNKNNNYDEYFDMKYSDEIVDLFLDMKEITKSYGSLLFYEKNRTSYDLQVFLLNNITLTEDKEYEEEINHENDEYE